MHFSFAETSVRTSLRSFIAAFIAAVVAAVWLPSQAAEPARSQYKAPRTADGQPDLQGMWTNATLTTLLRPANYGNQLALTEAQALAMERQMANMVEAAAAPSDVKSEAKRGENVGGYNVFWMDVANQVVTINGERRTSLIIDPPNGQLPPFMPQAQQRLAARQKLMAEHGFDGPELRALGERCLLGFGNNSGPPMLPVIYNSNYQIVQSQDSVVILIEMVHDARIVRLGGKHPPANIRNWMGDSIGSWEGDTLVVETTNFHPQQPLQIGSGASYRMVHFTDQMKVTERFTRTSPQTILYQFTVDDPGTFTQAWRGEMALNAANVPIYEYACHEGNYALPGILAGAREQEKQAGASASPQE